MTSRVGLGKRRCGCRVASPRARTRAESTPSHRLHHHHHNLYPTGANILTNKHGLIKLADFGVAIKVDDSSEDNSVVGTPYWMAPEIIEMSQPTEKCDIWSVGCTVIELFKGKPPYYDLQPMAALFRIVQEEHPPLPETMSQTGRDFLLQCFHKVPSMRKDAAQVGDMVGGMV